MADSGVLIAHSVASAVKRLVDILAASIGLCVLLPVMVVIALIVLCTDGPPVLHSEDRVGRHGKLFTIYKFRTLRPGSNLQRRVAPEDDPRITGAGLWLRRWRMDEFPQLFNVLLGHMSLVGPRPMPPTHAAALPAQLRDAVLAVRPGITDAAAIHFLAEDAVLVGLADPEGVYLAHFLPEKAGMQIDSIQHWSLAGDFVVLGKTLAQLWSARDRRSSAAAMRELLPVHNTSVAGQVSDAAANLVSGPE